ncbi:MAG: helix-turn-helix domain-containing protein [Candidatus Omnitrophota bacterium]
MAKKVNKKAKDKTPSSSSIMTPKQVAKYLSLHIITLYRLIKKGKLPSFKVGGQWRIKKDLLDSWIRKQSKRNGKEE